MARHSPLFYAVPLLLLFSLAIKTEAATTAQVTTIATASVSSPKQVLAQALAKLLHINGTTGTVTVKPPFTFNASIPTDTIKMAGSLLQQLVKLQPLLTLLQQSLQQNATATGRGLLADDMASGAILDDPSSIQTMTATPEATSVQTTNRKKVAQRVNLIMSDAWLVMYSSMKVAQVSFQLLAAMLKAGATGTVTIDTPLILQFSDVASNFASTVSYVLYSAQKLASDSVAPLGLVKVT